MDEVDFDNFLVLAVFAVGLISVIVGYLLAWRSKRAAYRKAGSLTTAAVAGIAGLLMLMWLLGVVSPFPPPDGGPLWEPLVFLLVLSPFPLGAFYICVKFIRQASRGRSNSEKTKTEQAIR